MPDMLEVGLFACVGANAVLGYSLACTLARRGAPYVPTASAKLHALYAARHGLLAQSSRLLKQQPHQALHLVDLGSGDGALVRAATRRAGFGRATGYEALVEELVEADLSDADVVLVYGVPPMMAPLAAKLVRDLRPDALVVSNNYALPVVGGACSALVLERVVHVDTPVWAPDSSGPLLVYRKVSPRMSQPKMQPKMQP
eukprot:CAMPEP_0119359698 /NCGR_PEP_ID=MMETSP1334-20130426/7518_1 /TAXON_ID=127549 /ORGANISM="Calcidiscus leptoporus, Strain RCC1130" /LENGTH=199 /DNA_ID=CAMNT_0007374413 /DNA_START=59 /DNA_END=659 /DNA_ORIENTATION=+